MSSQPGVSDSGFIDPNTLSFYSDIHSSIDEISSEFLNDSLELSLVKCQLGFENTWIKSCTESDEISQPVEEWIRSGGFHQEQIGYDSRDGEWKTFPLWKSDQPQLASTIKNFLPRTIQVLESVPDLYFASFFKQPPKANIKTHHHILEHYIAHFLLNDLVDGHALIQVNQSKRVLKNKGDCVVFDYTCPHSSMNLSNTDRINLVIDFKP